MINKTTKIIYKVNGNVPNPSGYEIPFYDDKCSYDVYINTGEGNSTKIKNDFGSVYTVEERDGKAYVVFNEGYLFKSENPSLIILANTEFSQSVNLKSGEVIQNEVIEKMADKNTIISLVQNEKLNRAILKDVSEDGEEVLPLLEERKNKTLVFDENGHLTSGINEGELLSAVDRAVSASESAEENKRLTLSYKSDMETLDSTFRNETVPGAIEYLQETEEALSEGIARVSATEKRDITSLGESYRNDAVNLYEGYRTALESDKDNALDEMESAMYRGRASVDSFTNEKKDELRVATEGAVTNIERKRDEALTSINDEKENVLSSLENEAKDEIDTYTNTAVSSVNAAKEDALTSIHDKENIIISYKNDVENTSTTVLSAIDSFNTTSLPEARTLHGETLQYKTDTLYFRNEMESLRDETEGLKNTTSSLKDETKGYRDEVLNVKAQVLSGKGEPNGYASLDENGKIPSGELPSYVDDVVEYSYFSLLPETGEGGKIYVTLDDNKTYRWSGTQYVEISQSLALGETEGTAYGGEKGKENHDNITSLQSAVVTLQNSLDSTNENVSTNTNSITSLQSSLNTTNTNVSVNTNNISSLQSSMTGAEGNITALQSTVSTQGDSISTNSSNISTLQSGLASANTDIRSNVTAINNNATAIDGKVSRSGDTMDGDLICFGDITIKARKNITDPADSGAVLRAGAAVISSNVRTPYLLVSSIRVCTPISEISDYAVYITDSAPGAAGDKLNISNCAVYTRGDIYGGRVWGAVFN